MSYLLRVIRKGRWLNKTEVWFDKEDFSSDCLADLATTGNALSLWFISEDRSNLDAVATAIAASRERLSNVDFAILPESIVMEMGVLRESSGTTPIDSINALWHRDLQQLSAKRLVKLADAILRRSEKKRVPEKEVTKLLRKACRKEESLLQKLKPALQEALLK